jgi:ankyrin repeat protein
MPSSIRKALDELPTTLDETYQRALQGIPKEKRQHAHRLFQCLVVAIRPLRVEELAEVFAIEFDGDAAGPNLKEGWRAENAEDAVLSACSTLIAVINNEDSKIVQFSHFSVKEYLTSDRLRTSEMENVCHYHIHLIGAHTVLARACLTELLQLDETMDKKCLETFPLAFYASQHWVDHAKYESVASRIQDAIEQLFHPSKPYLASWNWIYDVDSGWIRNTIEERPTRPEATALYFAARCGLSELANYLIITHGENVNAKCGDLGTPLHAASRWGHLDTARVLLARGSDLSATDGIPRSPLCSAHRGGHLEAMRLLLEHGADVDAYYDHMGLLLHDAAWNGRADAIHLLLQHNADVDARNYDNETPLHHASRTGEAGAAQLLLEHGAAVNAQANHGNTPLYMASIRGHVEAVQILLRHGADVHIRGGNIMMTPLQAAKTDEIAQLLLEHGAGKEQE